MEFHEVANLFPMMTPDEFAGLKEDIDRNGQIDPVWIHDGKIIDGRNRYLACTELGIEPLTREWNGDGDLVDFVVSMNVKRRHLTAGQKAFIALGILDHYAEQAKERMLSGKADPKEIIPQGTARDQAGAAVGVSGRYVSKAKQLAKQSPALAKSVSNGWLSMPTAEKILADRNVGCRHFLVLLFTHFGKDAMKIDLDHVRRVIMDAVGMWDDRKHMDDAWLIHHFGDPESVIWTYSGEDNWIYKFTAAQCTAPHGESYAQCCICHPEQGCIDIGKRDDHFRCRVINNIHNHLEGRTGAPLKKKAA